MAMKGNSPFLASFFNLKTPVVVSSEMPIKSADSLVKIWLSFCTSLLITLNKYFSSSLYIFSGSGKGWLSCRSFSHLRPSKIIMVMSPPSSTIEVGPLPSSN
jgi:hypothetical protein